MKNFTLLTLALIIGTLSLNAQSLSISGAPDTVYGGYDNNVDLESHMDVTNNGVDTIAVIAFRRVIQKVSGSVNQFCWGVTCFSPSIDTSTYTLDIAPGETETSFVGYYDPDGNPGVTTIQYCFYDDNNPSDSACRTVHYDARTPSSLKPMTDRNIDISVGPNPATNQLTLDLSRELTGNKRIVMHSIIGKKVYENKMDEPLQNLSINVMDIKEGVYFLSIEKDGRVAFTEKVIVSH